MTDVAQSPEAKSTGNCLGHVGRKVQVQEREVSAVDGGRTRIYYWPGAGREAQDTAGRN